MARPRSCSSVLVRSLTQGWECARSGANAASSPDQLDRLDWFPAVVPGTFASALKLAGAWDGESELRLDDHDVWYRTRFAGGGDEVLVFEGLATIADVWLNGRSLLHSESMFVPHRVPVRTESANELHICFRSLSAWLNSQRGRARWRPRLASPGSLRFVRTTLLGRMPGWCPVVHPVGPWRPVLREKREGPFAVESADVSTAVFDGDGRMVIRAVLDQPVSADAVVEVADTRVLMDQTAQNVFEAAFDLPDVPLWWPHTHGEPRLHPATLRLGDVACDLGQIGFRSVERANADGFALAVNGEPVFCRGACWTTPDVVALPGDDAAYRPWLTAARDAGMNMIRVGGTMAYEADAFFALCDELGLLVWQDAMLANFDYPAGAFRDLLAAELKALLDRTQTHPSLVVMCGGSEVLQQATMLGLTPDRIDASLYQEFIPDLVRTHRPDLLYVPNSPSGGAWPFQPDTGVTHYYGVGAYLRPLDDARRAEVRFASECLALANVPGPEAVAALGVATTTDPRWKRGVPRDPGAGWDFEDVRDHYLGTLFGIDPAAVRWADFPRYLDLSRAVSCVLIEQVFAEWRRVGSSCAGGLVWQFQDVAPGAGWGVLDVTGRRKAAWYALRRAFRPQQVLLTDEGLNGLHVHVLNESDQPLEATLRLVCLRDGAHPVRQAEQSLSIPARGAQRLSSNDLLPGFFDITYAYRFGPPAHEVSVATLVDHENNRVIAESVHFPQRRSATYALPQRDIGLEGTMEQEGNEWKLRLRCSIFGQFVHIEAPGFEPDENWMHLPPHQDHCIGLRPLDGVTAAPIAEIGALNAARIVRIEGRS